MCNMADNTEDHIIIYTDGACLGNKGGDPGGWAAVILHGPEDIAKISGSDLFTTNNRMELQAIIEGLNFCPSGSQILLYSDSQYAVKGFNEWLPGWKKKGWKNSSNKAVANKDLWQVLEDAVARHKIVSLNWIRGHNGDHLNEEADRLANEAIPYHGSLLDDDD